MAGGTTPKARSTTIPATIATATVALGPQGTACRRMTSGESTTSTVAVVRQRVEGRPAALEQQRVAGDQLGLLPRAVLAHPLDREDDEVVRPLHPGVDLLPDQRRAWWYDDLDGAGLPRQQGAGVGGPVHRDREGQVDGHPADLVPRSAHDEHVVDRERAVGHRPAFRVLDAHQDDAGVCGRGPISSGVCPTSGERSRNRSRKKPSVSE